MPADAMLDLGAAAKALAADRAAAAIETAIGGGVLVNLGGDIRVDGEPPGGGWRVEERDDLGPDGAPPAGSASGGHRSGTAAWPRRAPWAAAGGAAGGTCTTSSSRVPDGPPTPAGGR